MVILWRAYLCLASCPHEAINLILPYYFYFPAVSQLNGFEKGRWMRRLLFLPPRLLGHRLDIKSHAGGGAIALHKREL